MPASLTHSPSRRTKAVGASRFLSAANAALARPSWMKPKRRVEEKQCADHRRFDVRAEPQLQNDRGLQHPWDRRPELREENPPARRRLLADGVGAELAEPAARLGRSSTAMEPQPAQKAPGH